MSDTEIMRPRMFGRDRKPVEPQVIPLSERPDPIRRDPSSDEQLVSVIGESLHFKGELSAGEDLIIEGIVEGTINQGKCCLTLRPKGSILANVNATKIFVEGKVEGDLHATVSVAVRKTGVVKGNIVAPSVSLEEGATFNGSIEMRSPSEKKE